MLKTKHRLSRLTPVTTALILSILISFQGCFIICGPGVYQTYLSPNEKTILPYQDGEQLHFKRNDGTDWIFTIQRKYSKIETQVGKEWCIGTLKFDVDSVLFKSGDPSVIFPTLQVCPAAVTDNKSGIRFFSSTYENDEIFLPYDGGLNFVCGASYRRDNIKCIGSVTLNGIQFNDVYEIKQRNFGALQVKSLNKNSDHPYITAIDLFYSKRKGILRISYILVSDTNSNGNLIEYTIY